MSSFIQSLNIVRFDGLHSTNLKAREVVQQGAGEGTVVVARQQFGGRGRDGRIWHSPEGGLYLSVVLTPRDNREILDLPILGGVAVAQAIRELLPKSMVISLKWPNDCLLNWKKVSGVLCESLGEALSGLCVVGIGININISARELSPFVSNPFSATSFMEELGGGNFDLKQVEDMLLLKIFSLYETYQKEGCDPIRYLWEKNCRMIGKKIELSEVGWKKEFHGKKQPGVTTGTFLGLDDSGALVLANARGERRIYYNGEITCYWP